MPYQLDVDKFEAFADAFTMVQEDLAANEFNAARFALLLCEGYALVESARAQRAELGRVAPKRPVQPSPLFRQTERKA